jgi:cytochrome b561
MAPVSFSLPQRTVHWLMALFILYNLLFPDGMERVADAMEEGGAPPADAIFSANLHAYVGISILVLAIVRLCLRFVQGAPDAPDVEPPALRLLAKVTHGLLYLLFFAMPLSGVAAYYGGVEVAGFVHGGPMKLLMWILILAHIAGALVHQFYWKTDVLARMTRGVNRPASP